MNKTNILKEQISFEPTLIRFVFVLFVAAIILNPNNTRWYLL